MPHWSMMDQRAVHSIAIDIFQLLFVFITSCCTLAYFLVILLVKGGSARNHNC